MSKLNGLITFIEVYWFIDCFRYQIGIENWDGLVLVLSGWDRQDHILREMKWLFQLFDIWSSRYDSIWFIELLMMISNMNWALRERGWFQTYKLKSLSDLSQLNIWSIILLYRSLTQATTVSCSSKISCELEEVSHKMMWKRTNWASSNKL